MQKSDGFHLLCLPSMKKDVILLLKKEYGNCTILLKVLSIQFRKFTYFSQSVRDSMNPLKCDILLTCNQALTLHDQLQNNNNKKKKKHNTNYQIADSDCIELMI